MFGPVLEAYFKIFFITKYNIIVSIFYVCIGIINYKIFFLLYLIKFYTGFLSQSRHLQIEVVGGADDFGPWSLLKRKNRKNYCSVCSWLRPELELNIFINK